MLNIRKQKQSGLEIETVINVKDKIDWGSDSEDELDTNESLSNITKPTILTNDSSIVKTKSNGLSIFPVEDGRIQEGNNQNNPYETSSYTISSLSKYDQSQSIRINDEIKRKDVNELILNEIKDDLEEEQPYTNINGNYEPSPVSSNTEQRLSGVDEQEYIQEYDETIHTKDSSPLIIKDEDILRLHEDQIPNLNGNYDVSGSFRSWNESFIVKTVGNEDLLILPYTVIDF